MSVQAKFYIGFTVVVGTIALALGLSQWGSPDYVHLLLFCVVASLGSGLKVSLPSVRGNLSVNFFFILVAILQFGLGETLAVGCISIISQYFWRAKAKPKLVQAAFNVCSTAIAITASYAAFHGSWADSLSLEFPLLLAACASVYFVGNTAPVAAVIALTEGKKALHVWRDCYFWSFPYYMLGAGLAGAFHWLVHRAGWQYVILALPALYVVYRSYYLYLTRLQAEKARAEEQRQHAEEISALHLRTIEALALAIEAKDQTTHAHLQRVQVYAVEIGREMGLTETELEALHAAALLHDIGKLAVPEHIVSKPGRLTPEEFEKMKIHPVVGAEILEQVQFPYPVAPIVRTHHEKWDGSGYPDGLMGEEIPAGARILSAVDCLDALASDRQYRRALPLDEAMEIVAEQSGKAYDPRVVEILQRRYRELEKMARLRPAAARGRLSTNIKIERGAAPATGFERSTIRLAQAVSEASPQMEFVHSIGAAREEAQLLFEMAQELGRSLSLNETLSLLAVRLKKLVPHNTMAVYVRRELSVTPEFVAGDDFRLFSTLEIPLGQGLSGWVTENRKPIVNGNPTVEPGYLNDPQIFSTMRSALSVPLEGTSGSVGALTLYAAAGEAFSRDHLRILLAISAKLGFTIENSIKYRKAEDGAASDYLTGLPNARSLFVHLEQQVEECRRSRAALAVLIGDLNGFKAVNDRFGHLEGNRLLQTVAEALRKECRENDYVARMGGDEFAIVLPGMHPEAAIKVAHRMEQSVEAAARTFREDAGVTLSLGVAYLHADGREAEELLSQADRRMYVAKEDYRRRHPDSRRWSAADEAQLIIGA